MKLPLYHCGDKRVVVWSKEYFEEDGALHGRVKRVFVRYSLLRDPGELSAMKSRTILACEFVEQFEIQSEWVEIGWSRIVPPNEMR